jgi:hypothetical protein
MRTLIMAATAAFGLTASCGLAAGHYSDSPASNFSAYYYQSPGGVPSARSVRTFRGSGDGAGAVPYDQSCGKGRVWKGDRCVRE